MAAGTVAYVKTTVTPAQMKAALQAALPTWSDQALAVLGAMWSLETGAMGSSFGPWWTSSQFNYNPAGVTGSYQGMSVTPPGMTLTFRAYPDIASGVADWLALLHKGYPGSLEAATQGDLAGFTRAIGPAKYCGCDAASYTTGLQTRYTWWLKATPTGPIQQAPFVAAAAPSNTGVLAFMGAVGVLAGVAAFAMWPGPAYALLNPFEGELLLPPNARQQENAIDNKMNWIVDIDPREFLRLTVDDRIGHYPTLASINPEPLAVYQSPDAQANMIVHPHLRIDKETGKVTGHEGRHRAAAVMKAGGKWYRIGLQLAPGSRNYRPHDMPIIWTAQFTRHTTSINELVRTGKMRIIDQNVQKEYYREPYPGYR